MSVEQVICQLAYKGKRRKPPHFWSIYRGQVRVGYPCLCCRQTNIHTNIPTHKEQEERAGLPARQRRRRRTRGQSRGNPAKQPHFRRDPLLGTHSSRRSGDPSQSGWEARRKAEIQPMSKGFRSKVICITRVPMRNCLMALRFVVLVAERPKKVTGMERSQAHSQKRGWNKTSWIFYHKRSIPPTLLRKAP